MNNLLYFEDFLNECEGGGVGFVTPNGNGAGNIQSPTVGTTPGSVNQVGCGNIGSGDLPAYNFKKKLNINKKRKIRYYSKKQGL
jgi:hypothetical protein